VNTDIGPQDLDGHIYQRLLKERIVFLGSEVRDQNSNALCAQLLLLNAEDPQADIYFYINSPGGSVDSGLAIYDTMQFISNDVATVALGLAASMGQFLLASGTKGKRYALPNARIMIHQVSAGVPFGQGTDVEIRAREILRYKALLNEILARHTGKTVEDVTRDTERDYFMSARQALEYGLIDRVMTREAHEKQTLEVAESLKD
jgi:ATP-dependent Clp protease protease subunit